MQKAAFTIKYGTLYSLAHSLPFIDVYYEITIKDGSNTVGVYNMYDSSSAFSHGSGIHLLSQDAGIKDHGPEQGIRYNGSPVLVGIWKSMSHGWIVQGAGGQTGPHEPFYSTHDWHTNYYAVTSFPDLAHDEQTYRNLVGSSTIECEAVGSEYSRRGPLPGATGAPYAVFGGVSPRLSGVYYPMTGSDDANPVVLGHIVMEPEVLTGVFLEREGTGISWSNSRPKISIDGMRIAAPVNGGGFMACENADGIFVYRTKTQKASDELLDEIAIPGTERLKLVKYTSEGAWIDTSISSVAGKSAYAVFALMENRLELKVDRSQSGEEFLPPAARAHYFASIVDTSEYNIFRSGDGGYVLQPSDGGAFDRACYDLKDGDTRIAYTLDAPNEGSEIRLYKAGTEPEDGIYEVVSALDVERGGSGWSWDRPPLFIEVPGSTALFRMTGLTDWSEDLGIAHIALGAVWRGDGKI